MTIIANEMKLVSRVYFICSSLLPSALDEFCGEWQLAAAGWRDCSRPNVEPREIFLEIHE